MYEEPYRWVEAVGNRRAYLDEQFLQGSPVVGVSFREGILLLTFSKGTPKLYEIYDRIGLGGMGHPADLEKLRFSLLDLAHLEGFNRSPADVTASRLMRYGLAPVIKQAFEEIFKAPYITKLMLAEVGRVQGRDLFLTIDYDGTFQESTDAAALAATPAVQATMTRALQQRASTPLETMQQAFDGALHAWAVGRLAQQALPEAGHDKETSSTPASAEPEVPSDDRITTCLRDTMAGLTLECAVLEREAPGSSAYRRLEAQETGRLLPEGIRA